MNCKQARNIQIVDFLASIDIKPVKQKGEQYHYAINSNNVHPNLTVNRRMNKFYDFRNSNSGGIIDLVIAINNCSLKEALNILGGKQIKSFSSNKPIATKETGIFVRKVKKLENKALTGYLANERKIPLSIAEIYLKECYYHTRKNTTGKPLFALCWDTQKGGLELKSKYFKGSTEKKSHSFFEGSKKRMVCVFEGMLDMLSALTHFNIDSFSCDTIVLNSVSNYSKAKPLLSKYQTVNAFLDNDPSCCNLLARMRADLREVLDRAYLYKPYNDFNEFLINQK